MLPLAGTSLPSRADFTDDLTPSKGINSSGSSSGSSSGASPSSATKPVDKPKKGGLTPTHQTEQAEGTPKNSDKSNGTAAPKDAAANTPENPNQNKSPGSGSLLSDDLTKHDSNAPVNVSGKVMKGLRAAGRLDLEGDVVITQADARLLSDKATVFSEPATNRTKKAIARGNVKFSKQSTPQSPALKAEADEMEYLVAERQVFMTGKPKVWRGNELIQGKEIVLELDSGAVTVKEARGILEPNNVPKMK